MGLDASARKLVLMTEPVNSEADTGTAPAIAFLGTGLMGAPMAANLCRAGHHVTVWNRSPEKAAPLAGEGAAIASTAAEAVMGAGLVITMLSDGPSVAAVLFGDSAGSEGVARLLAADTVVVDMSSTRASEARDHAVRLAEYGIGFIDAPVSGGTRGAEAGSLAIMAGGEEAVFRFCKGVLTAMGRPVRVGPVGSGQLAKLVNQSIVAVTIGAVAEAMLLAEQGGADPEAVRHALAGGFADSTILQQHGTRMTEGDFAPGGLSTTQLKDVVNALDEASRHGLSLPLTEAMESRYRHLVEVMGHGRLDHSALWLELLERQVG